MCEPVAATLSLSNGDLENFFAHVQTELDIAKQKAMKIVESSCIVLGDKELLGKDWKEAVREVTDDGTAEAFWLNMSKPANVHVFTSESKAIAN